MLPGVTPAGSAKCSSPSAIVALADAVERGAKGSSDTVDVMAGVTIAAVVRPVQAIAARTTKYRECSLAQPDHRLAINKGNQKER